MGNALLGGFDNKNVSSAAHISYPSEHLDTSMEDNLNGGRPQWKTTSMEDDLLKDDLNERQPQWKTT